MSCVLSNKVLSPQNYLQKSTGDCFIINTYDDFKHIEEILYQKYYKRYAARVRVRQSKEPDLKECKYHALTKRPECSDGKITLAEFEEWLEASFPNRQKKQ